MGGCAIGTIKTCLQLKETKQTASLILTNKKAALKQLF
jgi:hypothetical protein